MPGQKTHNSWPFVPLGSAVFDRMQIVAAEHTLAVPVVASYPNYDFPVPVVAS